MLLAQVAFETRPFPAKKGGRVFFSLILFYATRKAPERPQKWPKRDFERATLNKFEQICGKL
jgi:hypothetical protein